MSIPRRHLLAGVAAGTTVGALPMFVGGAPAYAAEPPDGAVLSPDGGRALWSQDGSHEITTATRTAEGWSDPETLLSVRGTIGAIAFSPDGERIAFENPRENVDSSGEVASTHCYIAVYDFALAGTCLPPEGTRVCRDQVRYVDPVFAIDTDPRWSSDGTEISFVRTVDEVSVTELTRPAPTIGWQMPEGRPGDVVALTDLLAAPLSFSLERSGDGSAIAWITRENTERAVNFCRPGGPQRRIAQFRSDDGLTLRQLAVSSTGAAVAFTRGGATNGQGEVANPRSFPTPPEREIWLARTDRLDPVLVGPGFESAFSPDDSKLVWAAEKAIMVAELSWRDGELESVGEPEVLLSLSHTPKTFRFSPDSRALAYRRSTRIDIHDFATQETWTIPQPATGYDSYPAWSPDSTLLAHHQRAVGDRWGIAVTDVAARTTERIWQAPEGVGEDYYALLQNPTALEIPGDDLFWSPDGRIAFQWEGDGYRHLYAIPADGGTPTLLTPGDGEVESVELALDRTQLICAANFDDPGRRHLFSVGFDGGELTALTEGSSSQWAPTALADGALAYIDAGWEAPPQVRVRSADGEQWGTRRSRVPYKVPPAAMVEPTMVEFSAADGGTAYGQLYSPAEPNGSAVVFVHGGPAMQMLPGFHYKEQYSNFVEVNQYLASRGCTVLSVDFRGGTMYGHAFRMAPNRGANGVSEYQDILAGAYFLQDLPDVDPARIGIYGLSWGGFMTALALSRNSDVFCVGADLAGSHFVVVEDGIEDWQSPILLLQGDDDRGVGFTSGIDLSHELMKKRPEVALTQRSLPNEEHHMSLTSQNLMDVYTAAAYFLLDHLEA